MAKRLVPSVVFGVSNHGAVYEAPSLLETNGLTCLKGGKVLAHELAGLIERALN